MSDRDERGRFTAGNAAVGAGRPKGFSTYLKIVSDVTDLDQWRRICQKAVQDAIDGDEKARAWLSAYLIGKPANILDLAAADQELLRELLTTFSGRGISASDVFERMLQQMAGAATESDPA